MNPHFAWEQRKVREIADRYDNLRIPVASNLRTAGSTPYYGANGIQDYVEGFTHDGEFVLVAEDGANDLKNYPVKCVKGRIWVNNHAHVLQGKQETTDNRFLAYAISQADIESILVGGSRAKLNAETLMEVELLLPSKDEQIEIGNYIVRIDRLITLHQRMCIFFGSTLQIRMEYPLAFAWEQRKLGEVGKARSGIGFPDIEQGGVSGIPFFKVSDMNTDGNENEMIVANNYVSPAQITAHKWTPISELPAIFFAKVGAAVMLNRKRLCRFPFLLDNNTMAYSLNADSWDSDFAKSLFETVDLTKLVQVGALPSYNSGDIEDMEIMLPDLVEQRRIGTYFKELDNLITLHQRELKHTKNNK